MPGSRRARRADRLRRHDGHPPAHRSNGRRPRCVRSSAGATELGAQTTSRVRSAAGSARSSGCRCSSTPRAAAGAGLAFFRRGGPDRAAAPYRSRRAGPAFGPAPARSRGRRGARRARARRWSRSTSSSRAATSTMRGRSRQPSASPAAACRGVQALGLELERSGVIQVSVNVDRRRPRAARPMSWRGSGPRRPRAGRRARPQRARRAAARAMRGRPPEALGLDGLPDDRVLERRLASLGSASGRGCTV